MKTSEYDARPNCPYENTNFLSSTFHWWLKDIFGKGFKKGLSDRDLYRTLSEMEAAKLVEKATGLWEEEKKKCSSKGRKPRLKRVLYKIVLRDMIVVGILNATLEFTSRGLQPLALGGMISYFTKHQKTPEETGYAYLYALAIVCCTLTSFFLVHPLMRITWKFGIKLRICCSALVFRKSLKLTHEAFRETTVGQVVNLFANDIGRFDTSFFAYNYIWIAPLMVIMMTYFMYLEVGVPAIFGSLCLLFFIPLQACLGRNISKFRLKTALKTDERLRVMNEIISGIQVIKLYAWEKPFGERAAQARREEISKIRKTLFIRALNQSLLVFTIRLCIFLTIVMYAFYDDRNEITAKKVFVVTACFNVIKKNAMDSLPTCVINLSEFFASVKRIQKFLLRDELQTVCNENPVVSQANAVNIAAMSAKWAKDSADYTLRNISAVVPAGCLVGLVGPVGCGKSSLLQAITKEIPVEKGALEVNGRMSYASQEAWIFNGTVRNNILFWEPMDEARYGRVIKACDLGQDFQQLPHGDLTLVGERGITLSGGQKARINLARAVYRRADIYLLDDPLSAVDANVGRRIFNNCIRDFLKGKTCVVATHQLQYLGDVDRVLLMDAGQVLAQGTYDEVVASNLDFVAQLEKTREGRSVESIAGRLSKQTSFVENELESKDTSNDAKEAMSTGMVSTAVYRAYFAAFGSVSAVLLVAALFLAVQIVGSVCDFFLSFWVNEEVANGGDRETRDKYINIYTAIAMLLIFFAFARTFTHFAMCTRASQRIHNKMYNSVSGATMSFFDTNPSGRILNRFSKDIGIIDESLPFILLDMTQSALVIIGVVVIVSIINPLLLAPVGVLFIISLFMREVYIRTSRSLKRIEATTRSPIYSHLGSTLQGLTTIRSLCAQKHVEQQFFIYQDINSSASFLCMSTSRALGFWLDFLCVVFITAVTVSFFFVNQDESGGNVGLAITQSISLMGLFQWGIRQSTELSNQMTAVERVVEYMHLQQEPPPEKDKAIIPPKSWPENGQIAFSNVSLTYNLSTTLVLKDLNFTISPNEKIGIVGRTGAGKTSLTSVIFRLYDFEGTIWIDGIDTKRLHLHNLRSKISTIPQEPVLFSGTLRKNLDPFDDHSDDALWKALDGVKLKDTIKELPAGLATKISEGGTNLSVGQRQLVCLARAIVRENKIIVMDEATANVDPKTDHLIQTTIRSKFLHCTVLTIAHRLHTVMDSDRVIVLDGGRMVEFDHAHVLMENVNGVLYGMARSTGKSTMQSLMEAAKNHYTSR